MGISRLKANSLAVVLSPNIFKVFSLGPINLILALLVAAARVYVSAIKAMVPEKACKIIDQAIQMHGAAGISQWTPLAGLYTDIRHLRFADGPDEVHHMVVGRAEMQKYDLW